MKEEIEAGAYLISEFSKYAPLKAAFWAKPTEKPRRYLYLASDQFNGTGTHDAYGEVLRICRERDDPDFDPFCVKVIGGKNPMANAAYENNRQFPSTRPTRFGSAMFGGVSVDYVYIYPPHIVMPHEGVTEASPEPATA